MLRRTPRTRAGRRSAQSAGARTRRTSWRRYPTSGRRGGRCRSLTRHRARCGAPPRWMSACTAATARPVRVSDEEPAAHARRTMVIRMKLLTTERLILALWCSLTHSLTHTAEPKIGLIGPISCHHSLLFSVARGVVSAAKTAALIQTPNTQAKLRSTEGQAGESDDVRLSRRSRGSGGDRAKDRR